MNERATDAKGHRLYPDSPDDLEQYPRTVKRWNRKLKVGLFVIGVLLACAWALTAAHII